MLRLCFVKYDINILEIKKPRTLKTSEECNSYCVHSVHTHYTGPLIYDEINSGYQ